MNPSHQFIHKFSQILHPCPNFDYQKFEHAIKQDRYLQIQFNYPLDQQISKLYENYLKICDKILKSQVRIVNQLIVDLKEGGY